MKCNVNYSTFYLKCYANLYKNVKTSGYRLLDSIRLDVNHFKCYLVIKHADMKIETKKQKKQMCYDFNLVV